MSNETFADDISGADRALLEEACKSSGRSLSFWASFTQGLDEKSLALLTERAHMVSSEIPASCEVLQADLTEAISLFSKMPENDRETMLMALRDLVDRRNGRLN